MKAIQSLLACALLVVPAAIGQSLPDLGDVSQSEMGPVQERRLGQSIMLELRADPSYSDDPEVTDYLTTIGYKLVGVSKRASIQLMGSRLWGRFNPNHWDPVYAAQTGLPAPIQTGEMSSAYIAEMCVNHFGAAVFRNARIVCK